MRDGSITSVAACSSIQLLSCPLCIFSLGGGKACNNNQQKLDQAIKQMGDLITVKDAGDKSSNHGQNNCKAGLQVTGIIMYFQFLMNQNVHMSY